MDTVIQNIPAKQSHMNSHVVSATTAENIAQKLEVDVSDIKGNVVLLDPALLSRIMESGVLVDLTIKRWRGTIQAQPVDIGIDESGDMETNRLQNSYISLGRRSLLPKEILNQTMSIDCAARNNLRIHSFSTPWGYFVTKGSWSTWKERNDRYRNEYMNLAKRISEDSEAMFKEVLDDYIKMAPTIYSRQMRDIRSLVPTKEWMDTYVHKLEKSLPTPQEILDSFNYTCTYAEIPIPTIEGWQTTGDSVLDSMRQEIYEEVKSSEDAQSSPEKFYKNLVIQLLTEIEEACKDAVTSLKESEKGIRKHVIHHHTKEGLLNAIARYKNKRYNEDKNVYLSKMDDTVERLASAISAEDKNKEQIVKALGGVIYVANGCLKKYKK